jgi:alkanesulfonate monooxygenase SsuD/methylene tetrahydromethanopterin reductase-like flavin-dependent oxidoreductase (luciferase family)
MSAVVGMMAPMTTIGAVFTPSLPPERLRSVARTADAAGLDELWLWEDCFREGGVSSIAAALAWTDRLKVGVGVFPVPLRNVAITAMEIATLERMFPGRAIPGIGHGVQSWMAQVGVRPASPLTLLREYSTALRALLAGERLTVAGQYVSLSDVALDWPPPSAPAIHAAASGPRTLRLAGEIADGTVLTGGSSPDDVRTAVALAAEGRAAAGRTDPHAITVYLATATGPNAADLLRDGPVEASGYNVGGDAHAIADAVRALAEAGATAVILQPVVEEETEQFVRFVTDEVRPLVD